MHPMKINFQNKRELTFLVIGILMLGILAAVTITYISFLVDQLGAGLRSRVITEPTPRFEFDKAEELRKR